jgi:predicted regulator of Ras-like GTPase activity (Roadblock/LC7/MglB family)
MEIILRELNKTSDVVGSFIVAEDGIIVASDLQSEIDAEMIGALISSIIRASRQTVDKMEYGDVMNFMLEAEKNKLFFAKCRFGFLVVVTCPEANLGLIRVEVKNAVKKLEGLDL